MYPSLSEGIIKVLADTQGEVFRQFLARHSHIKKWMISADFCFEKSFLNRTYAITLLPNVSSHTETIDKIQKAISKDIKKIKLVSTTAIKLINDDDYFHFGFAVNDPIGVWTAGATDPKKHAKEIIDQIYDSLLSAGLAKQELRRFNALRQEAKAKRFNLEAFCQLMIFSSIMSGVIISINKIVPLDLVAVFPDRDTITIQHSGVYIDLIRLGIMGHNIVLKKDTGISYEIKPAIPNETGKNMWYDQLIRMPDYVASFVAQWDMEDKPSRDSKASPLFFDAYVDSKNMQVFNVRQEGELYIDLITAKKVV